MTVAADLIAAMKAFAESSNDLDFIEGWGLTGLESGDGTNRKIQIRNESVLTGQVWLNSPNFANGMFTSIAGVLGSWTTDDYDFTGQASVTLSAAPRYTEALLVFHNGVLLRHVAGTPTLATEYAWTSGNVLTFGAMLIGWIHARYLAT